MKKYCLYAIKSIIVLGVSAVLGLLLLIAVYMLPTDRIWSHVQESRAPIFSESMYFQIMPNVGGAMFDNYTEAMYLNMALVDDNNDALYVALESNMYAVPGDYTPQERLKHVLDYNENVELVSGPKRFWNGYMVFIKPLLMIFSYSEIRNFNLMLQSMLLFVLMTLMYRKGLGKYTLPLLLTYLFLNPICIAMNMTFAGYFYCTVIPCIIMLLLNDKLVQKDLYIFFFLIIGICVVYFNMNYFQIISFGIPLVLYFILNSWPQNFKEFFEKAIIFFAAWFLGYCGMMVMKWIFYAIFISPEIFTEMIKHMSNRLSTTYDETQITRIDAIVRNIEEVIKNIGWLIFEVIFIINCIVRTIKNRIFVKINIKQLIVVTIIAIVPIIRYIIFANHVYIHYWVTYRCLAMSIFAINVMLIDISEKQKREMIE